MILRHAPLLILTLIAGVQSAAQQPRIPPPGARGAPLAGPLARLPRPSAQFRRLGGVRAENSFVFFGSIAVGKNSD